MSVTEFDDLKAAWQILNRNLERQNAIAFLQFKENKVARFRSGLRPLIVGQFLQLIIGIIITAASAQFWVNHIGAPLLVTCGLLLHAYGIMFIAFAGRDLFLIRQIDYAGPVIRIQKRLAELRAWHIRAAVWHGFTGSVVWMPVMIVMLHGLGAKVSIDKPQEIIWLALTVLVCLAFNYGLMRLGRSSSRCGRALQRSWIGSTVTRAQTALDEIAQFEKE
jgi:hypothetical protein